METEFLLYGLPAGESDQFKEQLLFSNGRSMNDIKKVAILAKNQGFHSFRTATFSGGAPDFVSALNI